MPHNVTCPKCGHEFEDNEEFEKYENIVSEIVSGKVAPPRTSGYDVIGPDGKTYQVKHTSRPHKNKVGSMVYYQWTWGFGVHKLRADFLVLFAENMGRNFMFLLDSIHADPHIFRYSSGGFLMRAHTGNRSYLWNYSVTPETFMKKRDDLMRAQQLALEISFA